MLDGSVAAVLALTNFDLRAVPKQNLVVGVERDKQVLELMILQVPDGFLFLVRVCPNGDTVILAFLSAAILRHI